MSSKKIQKSVLKNPINLTLLGSGILFMLIAISLLLFKQDSLMVILAILLIIIGLIFFFLAMNRYKKQRIDYRNLFIMGALFIIFGISQEIPPLWIVGIALATIGGANKKQWGKAKTWSKLTLVEKKMRMTIIIALTILLLAGLAIFIATT